MYVRTVLPDISDGLFGSRRYAYIDVTVAVPKTATLKIDDSSGDMDVSDVQAAIITDSSGDQTLERIAGDLDVADSSGEIKIVDVGGGLRLKDSSGDVDVDDVQGDVDVDDRQLRRPRHPPRHRRRARARPTARATSRSRTSSATSSSTRTAPAASACSDVGGNFTVGSDGSGGIRYERVTGAVRVPAETRVGLKPTYSQWPSSASRRSIIAPAFAR